MKILVTRFSSIGDVVLTTPVLRVLHQQLDAEVHVLTKQPFQPLVAHNPHVAKVHILLSDWSEMVRILREEKYDICVDLHNNLRSRRLSWALRIPTYRFPKLNVAKWLRTAMKIDRLPRVHLVDRYFAALRPLGIEGDDRGLELVIPENEHWDLSATFSEEDRKQGILAVALGAAHATKAIPVDKLVAFLRPVDRPVVLLGGPADREAGDHVIQGLDGKTVVNLAGTCRLLQSASVIQQSAVVLTPDTGLMHIATALGKPMMVVWGNTIPEFGMFPYRPSGESWLKQLEVEGLGCRPCSKIGFPQCPKGHFRCMRDHPDNAVREMLRQLPHLS